MALHYPRFDSVVDTHRVELAPLRSARLPRRRIASGGEILGDGRKDSSKIGVDLACRIVLAAAPDPSGPRSDRGTGRVNALLRDYGLQVIFKVSPSRSPLLLSVRKRILSRVGLPFSIGIAM